MRRRTIAGFVVTAALVAGGAGVAAAAGNSSPSGPSRLDDGKDLLSQSRITQAQAIAAAQGVARGDLNEVDLEHRDGKLVWNVDVGTHDVKVDAAGGSVVAVDSDD